MPEISASKFRGFTQVGAPLKGPNGAGRAAAIRLYSYLAPVKTRSELPNC
jgi:hypothetical protein